MASSLSAIWLLIPDKDNYYYLNYFNLAAHSSQEIFEGAPSDCVLSVPPVNQNVDKSDDESDDESDEH